MNGQHLKAFLWLRWRLRVNQVRRAGTLNAVLLGLAAVFCLVVAVGQFFGFFLVGLFLLGKATPAIHLYAWDGLIAAFLFAWAIGLVTDLQRAEVLSLDKFLHLPVSPAGVFLINYLSSLLSLTLIVFVPTMIGLNLGLVCAGRPAMLLLFPLIAAFLLLITAATHQFQGWLAALMSNPRRRRTVLVLATVIFILIAQAPNLLNVMGVFGGPQDSGDLHRKKEDLDRAVHVGEIDKAQYEQRLQELDRESQVRREAILHTVQFVNAILPPGWLALGAWSLAEGDVLLALLLTLGMALLGFACLWRSYRTTLRLYTGDFSSGKVQPAQAAQAAQATTGAATVRLLERALPWTSEHVSAIALASFRSLLRAPEAKMVLLTPVLMLVVFGTLFLGQNLNLSEGFRPLVAFGLILVNLFTLVQLVGNQFGFDRSGFRVYVLCPAQRRDVLVGKNLAVAPLALGLCLFAVVLLQIACPMRWDHFLALLPQMVSMYLVFCLGANLLSILTPIPIASGSLRPSQVKALPVLLNLVFTFLLPVVLAPMLLPQGIEAFLAAWNWGKGMPIGFLLSLLELAAVVGFYRLAVRWEGYLLWNSEQRILNVVASKAE